MTEAFQALSARGLRATPQRIAIFQALRPRTDHPTVEALYHDVKNRYPSMSVNTVYTTLLTFEKAGLIRRIDAGEGKCRWDGNPSIHAHVICRICLRVDDVLLRMEPDQEKLKYQAAIASGYTIDDSALYFSGRCPNCQSHGTPEEAINRSAI